jgi:hypothetical protein
MEPVPPQQHPDTFFHVRIVIGIVLGLGITKLLNGAGHFIQRPGASRFSWLHFGWVVYTFLLLVSFWWWEYQLSWLPQWRFAVFLFLIGYTLLLFLLCVVLFPDASESPADFGDYFLSRRRWFFGLLGLSFVVDLGDSALKGADYFRALGAEYLVQTAVQAALCAVAMATTRAAFHGAFVVAALLYQLSWILRRYPTLG